MPSSPCFGVISGSAGNAHPCIGETACADFSSQRIVRLMPSSPCFGVISGSAGNAHPCIGETACAELLCPATSRFSEGKSRWVLNSYPYFNSEVQCGQRVALMWILV